MAEAFEHETLSGRIVPIAIGDADVAKIDPRLALMSGFALDAADAPARMEVLAVKMLAGRGAEARSSTS